MILKHEWEEIKDNLPDDATCVCEVCGLRTVDPTTENLECSGRKGIYETATHKLNWPVIRLQNEVEVQKKLLGRALSELNWIGLHKSFQEGGDGFEGWCAGPMILINDLFNYLHG